MTVRKCNWCKTEHLFCDTCGIGITPKHIEGEPIKVGVNLICEVCSMWLSEHGRLQLLPYETKEIPFKLWLQQDGSMIKEKVIYKGLHTLDRCDIINI